MGGGEVRHATPPEQVYLLRARASRRITDERATAPEARTDRGPATGLGVDVELAACERDALLHAEDAEARPRADAR
jgi:hypothetical protein